jgi:hypothetical protein
MGLLHWITHTATSAWNGIEDGAKDVWDAGGDALHAAGDFFGGVGDWIARRWKPIVAALVAGVTFAAIFTLCPAFGPAILMELAPNLLPAILAGLVSGAAGQAARDIFSGKTPGTDLILPAILSAALSGGGMALGRLALAVPWVENTPLVAKTIANLTGASVGDAAASAGQGVVGSGIKNKLGYIAVNVTPGPSDIQHIIEGPDDAPGESRPLPQAPARGIVDTLGDLGSIAKHELEKVKKDH